MTIEEMKAANGVTRWERDQHWSITKYSRDRWVHYYWCCDPNEDCGSNEYTSYRSLEELLEDQNETVDGYE